MTDTLVYVRSAHSRTHVAVMHDGEMLSNERCNLDDIDHKSREVLTELPPDDPRPLCERCFLPAPVEPVAV